MSFEKLEKFIKLAKETGVSELKYESKDEKYFVSMVGEQVVVQQPIEHIHQSLPAVSNPQNNDRNAPIEETGVNKIPSPFVGTFYDSPSPDAPAYVKVGDSVSKGQVLCIVEAMKIMNEIEADCSGVLTEICVENENYVEFGQTLFKIKAN